MESPRHRPRSAPSLRHTLLLAALLGLALIAARPAAAVHESTNTLVFDAVPGSPAPGATGNGVIDFAGGTEPTSRWLATFRFQRLTPDASYAVVVQGRVGDDGSAEALAFSAICSFRADAAGDGGCWYYLRGLRRLAVVQLRLDTAAGPIVLQATRAAGSPGAITSLPNRFSPSPAASPVATPPASPVPALATPAVDATPSASDSPSSG